MAPSVSEGAILSSFSWSENRQAGQDLDAVYDRLLKNNYPIKLPIEERWYPGQQ